MLKEKWWKFFRPKLNMYSAIEKSGGAIVIPETSPHLNMVSYQSDVIYSHALKVIALSGFSPFAVLQSRVHEIWARFFSSSMKDDLRYAPSDCFETFPFPPLRDRRGAGSRRPGLSRPPRRADGRARRGHDQDLQPLPRSHRERRGHRRLRELHAEMDRAVLARLWLGRSRRARRARSSSTRPTRTTTPIRAACSGPPSIRDEVLARLLALNAERHAEEVAAGLVSANGKKTRRKVEDEDGGDDLFADDGDE